MTKMLQAHISGITSATFSVDPLSRPPSLGTGSFKPAIHGTGTTWTWAEMEDLLQETTGSVLSTMQVISILSVAERQADWAVADHTEVLMLVADRPEGSNPRWRDWAKTNKKTFKNCYENIVTLQETNQEENISHLPVTCHSSPGIFSSMFSSSLCSCAWNEHRVHTDVATV